jgi:hypothetical protein
VASLLGLIKKSTAAAKAAFHRLHSAVADEAPAPAGEAWDYRDGTAPGDELVFEYLGEARRGHGQRDLLVDGGGLVGWHIISAIDFD